MVPQVGQRIGPYEILGRLGIGGMGIVFSAWDVRLQRDVAIKLLRDEFLTPGMRARFLQEARAASRLNHPNICTIFDIGEQQGDPYMVMELLKGETVRTCILRGGSMPQADIVHIATEVAEALVVAHSQGVVHRDIKPANIILVEKTGGGFQSKVLDFGLAKMDSTIDPRFDHTAAGTTVGTVSYMSPEQARGETLDARSDLFSLGIVLYEMSTGQLPFQGATSALIFVQLLSHRPEPIRELNTSVPRDLERVISKLLEKDRADRFQTAGELVQALVRIETKRPNVAKALWENIGRSFTSLVPAETTPEEDSSTDLAANASPAPPLVQRTNVGESVLRPVKRITASERYRNSSRPISSAPDQTALSSEDHRGFSTSASSASAPSSSESTSSASTSSDSVSASAIPLASETTSSASSTPSGSSSSNDNPAQTERFSSEAGNIHAVSSESSDRGTSGAEGEGSVSPGREQEESLRPALDDDFTTSDSTLRNWIGAAAIVLLLLCGWIGWKILSHHKPLPVGPPEVVLLGPMSNLSGDSTLDGVLLTGLGLDLDQSPRLSLRGSDDLATGLKLTGASVNTGQPTLDEDRRAARAIGATIVVTGEILRDNGAYVLSLSAYNVASGKRLAQETETTASRMQIADAIDRLASDLRSGLGERGDSISRTAVPLSREASSNLDALDAYRTGDALAALGQTIDAIAAFDRAVGADPHFGQAYLRLAGLYRAQHAEVAAARAAASAVNATRTAGNRARFLAESTYAIDAQGDYARALDLLRQLSRAYPGDIEAGRLMALAERLAGSNTDALATAQSVLRLSPFDAAASAEAELAMIALDRTAAATQLEQQSSNAGHPHPGIAVLLAYLSAPSGTALKPDAIPSSITGSPDNFGPLESTAFVLDAQGEMSAGLVAWNAVADHAHTVPALASSASYALARAALDQAISSNCAVTLELVAQSIALDSGPDATYAAGLAAALCGDLDLARQSLATLTSGSPRTFAAQTIYIPDLTAAVEWKTGDAAGALATLETARRYDLHSLSPFLRGLIHLSNKQAQLAITDFQTVLLHPGPTALVDPETGPLAQLDLARAYAATGDTTNSSVAYTRFLQQWFVADPDNLLSAEAQAHAQ